MTPNKLVSFNVLSTISILLTVNYVLTEPLKFRAHDDVKFSFASYYGNHMVLQRDAKLTVWGYHPENGVQVSVKVAGKSYSAMSRKGPFPEPMFVWSVSLEPEKAIGPFTLTASSGTDTIQLEDILFGDVWVCSGQSNMQFTMSMVMNSTEELSNLAKYEDIRVFTAAEVASPTPLYDLQPNKGVQQPWSIPTKDSLGGKDWSYFSAVCWLYGRNIYDHLQVPIGLIATDWGGTPVESWSSPDALKQCNNTEMPEMNSELGWPDIEGAWDPSSLWNAMVHPFLNITIKGAIWYQGEANAAKPDSYSCTFPTMIDDWRSKWHAATSGATDPQFPFGFVQLAGWREGKSKNYTVGFPDIRWHQTADFGYVPNPRMPRVFMAVAMDLPDDTSPYGSIHPRDKQDVCTRLALAGLSVAYGLDVGLYQGPVLSAYLIDIGFYTLQLPFGHSTPGHLDDTPIQKIRSKDGWEVCCSHDNTTQCGLQGTNNAKWTPAPIISNDNTSITLSWKACAGQWIMGVRYAWLETPCAFKMCSVYSVENGLPAPPYISEGIIGGGTEGPRYQRVLLQDLK